MNLNQLLLYWHDIIFISLCSVAFIQIFYFLYFFRRLNAYKAKSATFFENQSISVIICARDESVNLSKNLPASLQQQYAGTHEVIVVNDNSFDDSKYLLEEFQEKFKQ